MGDSKALYLYNFFRLGYRHVPEVFARPLLYGSEPLGQETNESKLKKDQKCEKMPCRLELDHARIREWKELSAVSETQILTAEACHHSTHETLPRIGPSLVALPLATRKRSPRAAAEANFQDSTILQGWWNDFRYEIGSHSKGS
jgi:hypothetical protein